MKSNSPMIFLPGHLSEYSRNSGAGFDVSRDSTCRDPQEHEWHVRRKQRKPSAALKSFEQGCSVFKGVGT